MAKGFRWVGKSQQSPISSSSHGLKNLFGKKKIILSANTDVEKGSFALDVSPLKFETCRERFARNFFLSNKGFYFSLPRNSVKSISVGGPIKIDEKDHCTNVAAFMLKTEKILKISRHSKFAETNRSTILWFEPCYFWRSCRMRRSLLTILLRAGMLYDLKKDNYEEALFKEPYVVPTKNAVMRFMYGFTKYVGPSMDPSSSLETKGWRTIFSKTSNEEVKRYLVSSRKPYQPKSDLKDQLWV
jgi:hypothetical protein